MEEKLFMKRRKKLLNVTTRQQGCMEQKNPCLRCRAKVRGLAHLTCCFVLSFYVGMGSSLRNKRNKEYGQAKSKERSRASSRF